MALFDFLKRKKEVHPVKSADEVGGVPPKAEQFNRVKKSKKPVKKTEKVSVKKPAVKKIEPKIEKKEEAVKTPAVRAKAVKFSYDAINKPHISEKASLMSERDQYIFEVSPNYNKNEIKNAVQGIYNVDVLSVNIIKIPAKKRRLGKTEGFRKAYKKAIIRIKNGQKIEIL